MSAAASRLLKLDTDNTPHFLEDIYVAVARRQKPWQYVEGWLEYSGKNFTGRFIASRMLMVKKKEGEFKYKPIAILFPEYAGRGQAK